MVTHSLLTVIGPESAQLTQFKLHWFREVYFLVTSTLYIHTHSPPRTPLHPHTLTPSQALDGFLLVLDNEGTILYVSDSIINIVGLTQVHTLTPPRPHRVPHSTCSLKQ